jgi:hypothetical protein
MMKKIFLAFAVAFFAASGAFAQEEETTSRWDIHGELRIYGQWGEHFFYGGVDNSYPRAYIGFNVNEYVRIQTQFRFGSVFAGSDINWSSFLKEAFISVDVLGLAGFENVGLVLKAGRLNISPNNYGVATGLNGVGTYSYANDNDVNVSPFNIDLTFSVKPVPLYLRWASDLDMHARNYNPMGSDKSEVNGWTGFAEVGLDHYNIMNTVDLSLNGFGTYTMVGVNNSTIDDTDPDNWDVTTDEANRWFSGDSYNMVVGGSLGVGILGLPVDLTIGGSAEYYNVSRVLAGTTTVTPAFEWLITENTGLIWSAGVSLGLPDWFTLAVNYTMADDGAIDARETLGLDVKPNSIIGFDFAFTHLSFMTPYVNLAFGTDSKYDFFNTNTDMDNFGWELGIAFPIEMPVGSLELITGWQRGYNSNNAWGGGAYGLGSYFLTLKAYI